MGTYIKSGTKVHSAFESVKLWHAFFRGFVRLTEAYWRGKVDNITSYKLEWNIFSPRSLAIPFPTRFLRQGFHSYTTKRNENTYF